MARPDFIQPVQLEGTRTGAGAKADFYEDLSGRLSNFTNQYAQVARRKADIEGEKEGLATALGGNKDLQEGTSVYDQAYNRGALQVWAAEAEIEVLGMVPEWETLAFAERDDDLGPTEWFQAHARGESKGMLSGMPAEIRPQVEVLLGKTIAMAESRVIARERGQARVDGIQTHDDLVAVLASGASDAYLNNDPESAQLFGDLFTHHMEQALQNYTFDDNPEVNAAEVVKRSQAFFDMVEEAEYMGGLDKAFDEGRAVDYIRIFSDSSYPGMTVERQSEIWAMLETRLGRREKHIEDLEAAEEAELKAFHETNHRRLTIAMLRGEYVDLANEAAEGNIDSDWAIKHEKRSKHKGPIVDNEYVQAHYNMNLGFYSYKEIMDEEELTYDTRYAIVVMKEELEANQANWRNSQGAQEGARRIRTALGIVDGVSRPGLSNKQIREANEAQSRWYTAVEALPAEQRAGKALELADIVTAKAMGRRAAEQIVDELGVLASYTDSLRDMPPDSDRAREQQRKIDNKKDEIARLEKVVANGR